MLMDKDYGHGFKVGDVVWLKMVKCFSIVENENGVKVCNATSSTGIRKATKSEARKFRKQYYKAKRGR